MTSKKASQGGFTVAKILGPEAQSAVVVTLGCAKNQVDSEVIIGLLSQNGFEVVNDINQAEVAIVNTCGFLEESVAESIDCILELLSYKDGGSLKQVIVTGCMVARYRDELADQLPEVDSFVAPSQLPDLVKVIRAGGSSVLSTIKSSDSFLYDHDTPRVLADWQHSAYVKIGEGCNRPCTFCIIPKLRGTPRFRPITSVVKELRDLASLGVREVSLIAQDTTAYRDPIEHTGLKELLRAVNKSAPLKWIRLLYAYPSGIDEELLRLMVESEKICNYLDLPLQHVSESILGAMKRPQGKCGARSSVELIKKHAPELALRTTFIVGFPGETEDDVTELEKFVAEGHFSSVGVFCYSNEDECEASGYSDQIPEKLKAERRERIMFAQQRVVFDRLSPMIDQELEVIIDGPHNDTDLLLVGRTEFQAPEVDGEIIINDLEIDKAEIDQIIPGTFAKIRITELAAYDLLGTLVAVE